VRRQDCGQHLPLVATIKVSTEANTAAASLVIVTICAAEGFDDRFWTEPFSVSTDDLMALVSFGKSLLAELTTAVAALWIALTCDFRALTLLLALRLVRPFMAS